MLCREEKSQIVWEIPMSFNPSVTRVYRAFFISFTSSCGKYGAGASLVIQDDLVLAHLYSCAVFECPKNYFRRGPSQLKHKTLDWTLTGQLHISYLNLLCSHPPKWGYGHCILGYCGYELESPLLFLVAFAFYVALHLPQPGGNMSFQYRRLHPSSVC